MSAIDSLRPPAGLRVLVTAGANGIGAAIARAFNEAGARVHVCDIDRVALDRLVTTHPGISSSMADVASERDVGLVFDDVVGTLGGLDVLVNNAGVSGPTGAIESLDPSHWERTVAVKVLPAAKDTPPISEDDRKTMAFGWIVTPIPRVGIVRPF